MKMKSLYLAFLLLSAPLGVSAGELVQKANQAYDKELYNEALELYLKAQRDEGTSSSLYYNMGNTYYRLKDNAHAIVCYERALLLNPSNDDARYNLEFVREKAQISDDSGASFFTDWVEGHLVSRLSSDVWATTGIVAFVAMLLLVALYLFVDHVWLRKVGFFGAIVLLLLTAWANVCAFHMHRKAVDRREAIVVAEQATLSTAPRVPKDKTEEAMTLSAGHKVQIVDSVTNAGVKWIDVRTADGHRAWVNAKDIEVI